MANKKILVVDDSETACMTIKAKLEENGDFEVRTETKGNLALAAAQQFKPDLVLLDLLMPNFDGVSVALQLHDDPFFRDIPVIILTAVATEGDLQQHGDIFGGYPVVPKESTTQQLLQMIKKHM